MPDDDARAPEASSGPSSDAMDAVIARLTEIVGSLQQLLDVQVARARVEMRERAFQALGVLLAAVLMLALTLAAGLYVLRGLAGLLTVMLGNVSWAGDLATGMAGLLLALTIGFLWRLKVRRTNLRRMRGKFRTNAAPQPEAE